MHIHEADISLTFACDARISVRLQVHIKTYVLFRATAQMRVACEGDTESMLVRVCRCSLKHL